MTILTKETKRNKTMGKKRRKNDVKDADSCQDNLASIEEKVIKNAEATKRNKTMSKKRRKNHAKDVDSCADNLVSIQGGMEKSHIVAGNLGLEKKRKKKKTKIVPKGVEKRVEDTEIKTNKSMSKKRRKSHVEDGDLGEYSLASAEGRRIKKKREKSWGVKKKGEAELSHGETCDPNTMTENNLDILKEKGMEVSEANDHGMAEVYQIPLVEEDSSKGMKKWITEYHRKRPGLKILQRRVDDFITSYEEQKEQEIKEREARQAEDGWTVVGHNKGRKKTKDSMSGVTVGGVSQAAVTEKPVNKRNEHINLYRFHKKEAQRNEIMTMRSKFEEDKKRVQQLRAARKFQPY